MTNTGFRAVAFLSALAMAALASNAAGAKSGGAHSGSNSAGATSAAGAKTSRDASSGQATGKRMYKPVNAVKESARTNSPKSKLTPDKVEAGSENIRR